MLASYNKDVDPRDRKHSLADQVIKDFLQNQLNALYPEVAQSTQENLQKTGKSVAGALGHKALNPSKSDTSEQRGIPDLEKWAKEHPDAHRFFTAPGEKPGNCLPYRRMDPDLDTSNTKETPNARSM